MKVEEVFKALTYGSTILAAYIALCVLHAEVFDFSHCSTTSSTVLRLLGYPVFVTAICFIYHVSTVDPGRVRKSTCSKADTESRHCDVCDLNHPINSKIHHCRVCGYCVAEFDHHCNVLGNCIGHNNKLYFVLLIFLGAVGHGILASISLCSIVPGIYVHILSVVATGCNALFSFDLVALIALGMREFYDHGLAVYFFTVAGVLIIFFGFHVLLYTISLSTLSVYQTYFKRSNTNWLDFCHRHDGVCVEYIMIALRSWCVCDNALQMRWKVIASITIPFSIYAIVHALHLNSIDAYIVCFLHLSLTATAVFNMRKVVFSRKHCANANTRKQCVEAVVHVNITENTNLLTTEEDGVVIELGTSGQCNESLIEKDAVVSTIPGNAPSHVTRYSPSGQTERLVLEQLTTGGMSAACDICDMGFLLGDHHCHILGTCIHLDNRASYIRFCMFGWMSLALLLPAVLQYLWTSGYTAYQDTYVASDGGMITVVDVVNFTHCMFHVIWSSTFPAMSSMLIVGLAGWMMLISIQQMSYLHLLHHAVLEKSEKYREFVNYEDSSSVGVGQLSHLHKVSQVTSTCYAAVALISDAMYVAASGFTV